MIYDTRVLKEERPYTTYLEIDRNNVHDKIDYAKENEVINAEYIDLNRMIENDKKNITYKVTRYYAKGI